LINHNQNITLSDEQKLSLQKKLKDLFTQAEKSQTSLSALAELKSISDRMITVQHSDRRITEIFHSFSEKCKNKLAVLSSGMSPDALQGNMSTFKPLKGPDVLQRISHFFKWQDEIRQSGLWYFEKSSSDAIGTYCQGKSDSNLQIRGVNFASQDYLNLSSHPRIIAVAKSAADRFGVHSAGSPALFGNSDLSLKLEDVIAKFVGMSNVTLFPTGWGAGYGILTALIRPTDHILMDKLSHTCLQEGAFAATKKVNHFPHLNNEVVEEILEKIRSTDKENAILIVTESLFSMDSDSPDLQRLQFLCHKYQARLLVDVAHDLGCLGDSGLGAIEKQNMVGKLDIVMGSFSKTFASNGGFVATNFKSVKEYCTFFSGPRAFSNALSPIQAAIVIRAFEIIQSDEGNERRRRLLENAVYLRSRLEAVGMKVKGIPSAIIPIVIGSEGLTRLTTRLLIEKGILTNIVEFPGVPKGEARLRVQIMANHTKEDLDLLVDGIIAALNEANVILPIIKKIPANFGQPKL
jgi:glycine C-acetyltransferase